MADDALTVALIALACSQGLSVTAATDLVRTIGRDGDAYALAQRVVEAADAQAWSDAR